MGRKATYNLGGLAITPRTLQAIDLVVPLKPAVVTEDNLIASCCIEMLAIARYRGRHGRLITPIDSGSGAQSKADYEAGETKSSGRHFHRITRYAKSRPVDFGAEYRCRA